MIVLLAGRSVAPLRASQRSLQEVVGVLVAVERGVMNLPRLLCADLGSDNIGFYTNAVRGFRSGRCHSERARFIAASH